MRQAFVRYGRLVWMAVAFALLVPFTAYALDVPPVPTDIPVVDQTNTLSNEQKAELAALIAAERKETGNQIGVLMISSLDGEVLEEYSLDVARQWGIGNKERDSGVLLLVAKDDRKIRIEVGYGLEGALTDARSSRIIRDRIAPEFRENKYYEGLQSGLVGITTAIHGEKDTALDEEETFSLTSLPWELLVAGLFFIPTWLAAMLGRTKSWWAGGVIGAVAGVIIGFIFGFIVIGIASIALLTAIGLIFDKAVSANYRSHASRGDAPSWWAGGPYIGGGRNSSGGFGGFGGGGFGGGGSSGSW